MNLYLVHKLLILPPPNRRIAMANRGLTKNLLLWKMLHQVPLLGLVTTEGRCRSDEGLLPAMFLDRQVGVWLQVHRLPQKVLWQLMLWDHLFLAVFRHHPLRHHLLEGGGLMSWEHHLTWVEVTTVVVVFPQINTDHAIPSKGEEAGGT